MASSRSTGSAGERFLLLGILGRGGMASVYRAFDRSEGRIVALKVPSAAEPPGPRHPFSEEFDVWSRLGHRNIVRAFELGLARGGPLGANTPYLVLEHVRGKALDRLHRPGRMPGGDLLSVAEQVLDALGHVHARGFVHRDVKPSNVLAGRDGRGRSTYKLTDFGLAKPIGSAGRAGSFSGSLPYVSPEMLLGLPVDGRADLYGLGILLYYLSTGNMPMPRLTPDEMLRWHLGGPPADPYRVRPALPPRLVRFIRRLTARDRTSRPGTARAALRLLGRRRGPSVGRIAH